jgi:ATPase family associated with various cellular activities (AAA)
LITEEEFYKLPPDERKALIETETQWEHDVLLTFSQLDAGVRKAVTELKMSCPVCKNQRMNAIFRGKSTGAIRHESYFCSCGRAQLLHKLIMKIPIHDRGVVLSKLGASTKSLLPLDKQAVILKQLRANPKTSYIFFGPSGSSKTTFSTALFRNRLVNWVNAQDVPSFFGSLVNERVWASKCPVVRISAKTILEDFVKESMHELDRSGKRIRPGLNRAMIERNGSETVLLIEEIDKVRYTPFKISAMFELIDACYENGAQLLINTNLTEEAFASQFGPENGEAIIRRIAEIAKVYNFYDSSFLGITN